MRLGLTGAVFFCSVSAVAYGFETPHAFKQKYRQFMSQEPTIAEDGSVALGEARLFYRGKLRVLYVQGDKFEMAYQHGRLLRDDIRQGALPQTAMIVRNSVLNAFPLPPNAAESVIKTINHIYGGRMVDYASKSLGISEHEFLADAYGMAEGSGLSADTVVNAFTGPETLQVILGEKVGGGSSLPAPLSVSECTDFAVRSSRGDGMIIGRNTDYPLNGSFDRFPTVVYYHPTDGDQKFMSVTSAGLHTAGVVGLNESGLFVGIHTIPTQDVGKNGFPAFFIGERVLRKAKNFEEAVRIFSRMKPAAGWAYTLVSTHEKRSAAIEFNNKNFVVRESRSGAHIQTNHYMTDAMKSANLDLNATVNQDTQARYRRVQDLLDANNLRLDADGAVKILADKVDPITGQTRGLGNVVAVHTTLTSAVVDSHARKVYVATGTAPVSLTPFVEVPIVEDFDPHSFLGHGYSVLEHASYHSMYPDLSRAEQLYIEAKTAYETDLNPRKSAEILKDVVIADKDNPGYQYMLALMYAKSGDFSSAEEVFKAVAVSGDEHYRLASNYFLGRIAAHRGDHHTAEGYLDKVVLNASPRDEAPLLTAARRSLDKVKRFRFYRFNHKSLAIFMPEADVVQY